MPHQIKLLHKDLRQHIHNIYGFVRLTDEIVDAFHDFEKSTLLQEFNANEYFIKFLS
ncbi:MAG: squalene/phytoene synthase family protein [Parafilimonas sp.]